MVRAQFISSMTRTQKATNSVCTELIAGTVVAGTLINI